MAHIKPRLGSIALKERIKRLRRLEPLLTEKRRLEILLTIYPRLSRQSVTYGDTPNFRREDAKILERLCSQGFIKEEVSPSNRISYYILKKGIMYVEDVLNYASKKA